jgi:hypothetical protein
MRLLGGNMEHDCIYCKDGKTYCFGQTPTKGSGLIALCCPTCIAKYEAIEDREERKKAIWKDAAVRLNEAGNELYNISSIYMPDDLRFSDEKNIAADEEMSERLVKAVKILMNWDQDAAAEEPSEQAPTPEKADSHLSPA